MYLSGYRKSTLYLVVEFTQKGLCICVVRGQGRALPLTFLLARGSHAAMCALTAPVNVKTHPFPGH